MIQVFCGFENDLENRGLRPLRRNQGRGADYLPDVRRPADQAVPDSPRCNQEPEGFRPSSRLLDEGRSGRCGLFIAKSIRLGSAFLNGGLFGTVLGIFLGAFAGATGSFSDFLPSGLAEQQGKLLGAVFLGLLGGAAGFVFLGAVSFLAAAVLNFVFSVTGGLKIKTGRRPPVPEGSQEEKTGGSAVEALGFNLRD